MYDNCPSLFDVNVIVWRLFVIFLQWEGLGRHGAQRGAAGCRLAAGSRKRPPTGRYHPPRVHFVRMPNRWVSGPAAEVLGQIKDASRLERSPQLCPPHNLGVFLQSKCETMQNVTAVSYNTVFFLGSWRRCSALSSSLKKRDGKAGGPSKQALFGNVRFQQLDGFFCGRGRRR